jgi:Cu+-exporting ATPase
MTENQNVAILKVEGMHCAACQAPIEQQLKNTSGVTGISFNLANRVIQVDGSAPASVLISAVARAGYVAVIDEDNSTTDNDQLNQVAYRDLISKTAMAMGTGIALMLFGRVAPALESEWSAPRALWLLVAVITAHVMYKAGRHYFIGAWRALRARSATMDTLIALGTGMAWLYSATIVVVPGLVPDIARYVYFEAAVIIIGMVNLGQALEQKARGRTSNAIRRLLDLQQKTARVVREGNTIDVPIKSVVTGDLVRIRPGEMIAVDGVVSEGQTNVDESMLSGEPIPVMKTPGDVVSAGTLNRTGSVLFRATRVGADTALARIIKMVRQAQASKPPIGRLADVIAGVFVPVVLLIAISAALVWFTFGPEPRAVYAMVTAVTVLIIACPCALGLATPMSVMVGIGKAAEAGVLIRNGEALQTASRLTTIVLDKTGTITAGQPQVVEVVALGSSSQDEIMRLATSLEAGSEHPMAHAIIEFAKQQGIEPATVTGFEAIAGQGVGGQMEGSKLLFGNMKLLQQAGIQPEPDQIIISEQMAEKAWTPMFLAVDTRLVAIIAVADPLKPGTVKAIKRMLDHGLNLVMLTGDNQRTATAVAGQVGITQIFAEVLPDDKKDRITELQQTGEIVGMVGDGINDAPALALAHVGFAIGTGTDVAIESADVTLMRGSLHGVADAMDISAATMRNIRQNLFGAFVYNTAGIPIAAGVLYPLTGMLLNPIIAGAAMAFSSVTVVSNANRLRYFRFNKE